MLTNYISSSTGHFSTHRPRIKHPSQTLSLVACPLDSLFSTHTGCFVHRLRFDNIDGLPTDCAASSHYMEL
jgi:hypothetical protein